MNLTDHVGLFEVNYIQYQPHLRLIYPRSLLTKFGVGDNIEVIFHLEIAYKRKLKYLIQTSNIRHRKYFYRFALRKAKIRDE